MVTKEAERDDITSSHTIESSISKCSDGNNEETEERPLLCGRKKQKIDPGLAENIKLSGPLAKENLRRDIIPDANSETKDSSLKKVEAKESECIDLEEMCAQKTTNIGLQKSSKTSHMCTSFNDASEQITPQDIISGVDGDFINVEMNDDKTPKLHTRRSKRQLEKKKKDLEIDQNVVFDTVETAPKFRLKKRKNRGSISYENKSMNDTIEISVQKTPLSSSQRLCMRYMGTKKQYISPPYFCDMNIKLRWKQSTGIKAKHILDVKLFLFSYSPMKYVYPYAPARNGKKSSFIDFTSDDTGEVYKDPEQEILGYASQKSDDTEANVTLKYHSDGNLDLALNPKVTLQQNTYIDVILDDFIIDENGEKLGGNDRFASARCESCIPKHKFQHILRRIRGYTETNIDDILNYLIASPPSLDLSLFKLRWLVDQIEIYCAHLLYDDDGIPSHVQDKLTQAYSIFPRKKHYNRDNKYLEDHHYLGCAVRKEKKGKGMMGGFVEKIWIDKSSNEKRFLVGFLGGYEQILSEAEVEEFCIDKKIGLMG